eukprot:CCRYP_018902-RA/>CCRYP_018902-RA protein AED:0.12 eAED:0.21 QI:14/0/0/1/0/0/4/0/235
MSLSALSSNKICNLGLEFVGFDTYSQDLSICRFWAHYGGDSPSLKALIFDMEREGIIVTIKSLFLAINWPGCMNWRRTMGIWREVLQRNGSKILEGDSKFKSINILFDDLNPDCQLLAVDTVHVYSEEFRCDPNGTLWSHEFNGPGSFKVVCGPVIGKISYNKDAHSPRTKRLFARMKYTLETCNGRLKNFKVVHESCCHGQGTSDTLKKIKVAFEAAAVLVQYDIENRPSLFEI